MRPTGKGCASQPRSKSGWRRSHESARGAREPGPQPDFYGDRHFGSGPRPPGVRCVPRFGRLSTRSSSGTTTADPGPRRLGEPYVGPSRVCVASQLQRTSATTGILLTSRVVPHTLRGIPSLPRDAARQRGRKESDASAVSPLALCAAKCLRTRPSPARQATRWLRRPAS